MLLPEQDGGVVVLTNSTTSVLGRVRLRAESMLTAATSGGSPVELIPRRGLRFGVKDDASMTVEFVLGASGAVEKVIVQPAGIFTPKSG